MSIVKYRESHYVTVLYELRNRLLLMKRKAIEMFTLELVMLRHSAPYRRPAFRYMGPSAKQQKLSRLRSVE